MKLILVKKNLSSLGGSQKYVRMISEELKEIGISYEIHSLKDTSIPRFLPSWIQMLLFDIQTCKKIKKQNVPIFAFEKLSCANIFRIGDGVKKEWLLQRNIRLPWYKRFSWMINPFHLMYMFLEKKTILNTKLIIANSERVKEDILKHYKVDPKKIKVVHNGVENKEFIKYSTKEDICKELGISKDKKIILFIGNGFFRKGVLQFLTTLSKLKRDDFHAVIIGGDKHINKYKQISKNLDVKADFIGKTGDTGKFLIASDIFLFPTIFDPFSNVVLEAMIYKNAVITTKNNGASEVLENDFVMKNPEDYSIHSVIKRLLDDENYLKAIQEDNYNKAKTCSAEKNRNETLKLIMEEFRS